MSESGQPVAIIGMAGQYAGTRDLAELWRMLTCEFIPQSSLAPVHRIDSRREGDPFVHMSSVARGEIARLLTPPGHFLLEVILSALAEGGYTPGQLERTRTGVWIAMGSSVRENAELALEAEGTCNTAANISRIMDWWGPSLNIRTECSSSLVALHLAVQSLLAAECDYAIVGAAHASFTRADRGSSGIKCAQTSPVSQCRPFSASANGVVSGEGGGALFLRRWQDARRDCNHVHGTVLASGYRHAGGGHLGPINLRAQAELMVELIQRAEIPGHSITYIEPNAVGEPLADVVEYTAMKQALGKVTNRRSFCFIGSSKPHLGHLESASGMAGVHKVLLAMRRGKLPATPYLDRWNPALPIHESPLVLLAEEQSWSGGDHPLRACVNAYGSSGIVAQVLLERPPSSAGTPADCDEEALHSAGEVESRLGPLPDEPGVINAGSGVEGTLRIIICRVCRKRLDPGPTASFLRSGLDSVDFAAVSQAISASIGQELPLTLLFEFPTVGLLARRLESLAIDCDVILANFRRSDSGT